MFRAFLLTIVLLTPKMAAAQAPPASAEPSASPSPSQSVSARRQDELRRTIEKRKAVREKQAARRQRLDDAANRDPARGGNVAGQAHDPAALAIEAQKAHAEQIRAEAAAENARINRSRLRLESQALGQPQLFIPGEGYVPYPYGVAMPFRPYRILPLPGVSPLPRSESTSSAAAALSPK